MTEPDMSPTSSSPASPRRHRLRSPSSPSSPSSPTTRTSADTHPPPVSHVLRSSYDNRQPGDPLRARDQFRGQNSAGVAAQPVAGLSRRCSRDSDTTLVASPHRSSSPYANFYLKDTCDFPAKSMSSSHYPPRSDSYNSPPKNVATAYASSHPEQRRPLIDLVTNEWQNKSQHYRDSSFDSDDSYSQFVNEKDIYTPPHLPEWLTRILRIRVPRRVQRYLGGYILCLLALWLGWLYWLQPAWQHEKALDESATLLRSGKGQKFGVNMRPTFTDMIHLQELDSQYLPTGKNGDRRLVFVGDVHGCKDELEQLLDRVGFNPSSDHLILTGDLIAKGPDSSGAVDLAMKMGASCVRGNWEDRILLAHASLTSKVHPLPGPAEDPHTKEDFLDEESFSHGDYKDRALAKLLSKEQVKWLKKCPVILRVGSIPGFNGGSDIVVAHAGLVPGIDYERQDPFQAMNMRSIDLKTRVPSEDRKGEPWEKLWNHHMNHLDNVSKRATIVYGHDSKRGLNIHKYSKGLDSGCLRGGSLTAMVIDAKGRQKFVSVDCKRYKD